MDICGSCPAFEPSPVIGHLEEDRERIRSLLPKGPLTSRYIRNTNVTGVYQQRGGTCYAYASCSAYLNTAMRMRKTKQLPSFIECYEFASYQGVHGGNIQKSIEELEDHFHLGVKCDSVIRLPIREAISISVVISFATSEEGWNMISNGSLLTRPKGAANDRHAALVEGYDFDKDCMICKNSWAKTGAARFDLNQFMLHDYLFYRIYSDDDNIDGKSNAKFNPNCEKFTGKWKDKNIDCAWMDEESAVYCKDYLCEHHPERKNKYQYLGYNIDQWININLNRSEAMNKYYQKRIREKEIECQKESNDPCNIC